MVVQPDIKVCIACPTWTFFSYGKNWCAGLFELRSISGIPVVVNVIKDLAKQTAMATGKIRGKIEGIQSTTQGTVSQIEMIAKVVGEVNTTVATISSAIEEQSSATKEISMNVSQARRAKLRSIAMSRRATPQPAILPMK